MQNLTQIHLKAKHGLMLGGKISHFWLLWLRLYGGRREEKKRRRKEENKIKIRRNLGLEFDIG